MNIYAKQGDKVVFLNRNGHEWQRIDAAECGLIEGGVYTVDRVDVKSFSSTAYLTEVPEHGFNTVMFRDEKVAEKVTCITCKTNHEVFVNPVDMERYKNGTHAQDAFPYLTEDQRELLISQICGTCFDAMFEGDEDE